MKYSVINGNNIDVLKQFPDNYFDSVVTDPPYGIDFLGKEWDANVGALATYQECLRVLKPGGYLLAFSAARTYHHLAVTVEQAGFDIRDQIMWIYSSGFPKSQDIGRQLHKKEHGRPDKQRFDRSELESENGFYRHKVTGKIYRALPDINGDKLANSHEGQGYGVVYEEIIAVDNPWSGWGTCLKPAHEPIVMAQKPTRLSFAKNCQKWGVGALNIDAGRVPYESEQDKNSIDHKVPTKEWSGHTLNANSYESGNFIKVETNELGRFPSNVIGEIPDYQKYFYCPKVGRAERHVGFDELPEPDPSGKFDRSNSRDNANERIEKKVGNNHPTVKPIELMKYLIQLVTPAGGKVLDPFNGSGSTGCAAVELDYDYTGIELDPKYVDIARKRIEAWYKHTHPTNFKELFE